MRIPRGVEGHLAVDCLERVWQRQLTDAAVGDDGASGKHWPRERSIDFGAERRRARTADVAIEPLKNSEVGIPGRGQRDRRLVQVESAAEIELGALAEQPQLDDLDDVLIERELDRARHRS